MRKLVVEGGWVQKRMCDVGWSDEKKCQDAAKTKTRRRTGCATVHFGPAPFLPLRWPDCTLSRLRAEEYDRPVTQSIATLEPSSRTIPTLDRTLVAR